MSEKILGTTASGDLPSLLPFFQRRPDRPKLAASEFDLWTRMLFTCLVDADRLDSAGGTSGSEYAPEAVKGNAFFSLR